MKLFSIEKKVRHNFGIWFWRKRRLSQRPTKEYYSRSIYFGYYPMWKKPYFDVETNGAVKGVDLCYDLNIRFGYFCFTYTNWDYGK